LEHGGRKGRRVTAELCRSRSKKRSNCRHGLWVVVGCTGGFEGEADVFPTAGDAGPIEELVWGKLVVRPEVCYGRGGWGVKGNGGGGTTVVQGMVPEGGNNRSFMFIRIIRVYCMKSKEILPYTGCSPY
jgi:hypothetical protein